MNRGLALLLFLTVIAGCRESGRAVSFGYQPFGSNLPFFVAVEQGFFADEGIEVRPVSIISANDAATAVVTGQLVGNATVPLNVLLNMEETQPGLMKIFMIKATYAGRQWSDYLLVSKNSRIDSIPDLRGRRIGRYPGTAQHMLLTMILRDHGMSEEDVTIVEMPPAIHLQALAGGQIDALLTYDETALIAIKDSIADVLLENPIGRHVIDPMYGFPYVLSAEFIRTNPDGARAIRNAMYRAIEFIENNEGHAREIMARWGGARPEIAAEVNLWAQVRAEDVDSSALQRLADFYFQEGVLNRRVDTSQLLYVVAPKLSSH